MRKDFKDWLSREDYGNVEQLRRAWDAGAAHERDRRDELLDLLRKVEKAAKGTGDYIGRDGQLIKEVRAAIADAPAPTTPPEG